MITVDRILEWSLVDGVATFAIGPDAPVSIVTWNAVTCVDAQPLVEVVTVDHGRSHSGRSYEGSFIGARLRYLSHEATADRMEIHQVDEVSGLHATSVLSAPSGASSLRSWTVLENGGSGVLLLQAVSSFAMGVDVDLDEASLLTGSGNWLAENRWSIAPARDVALVDYHDGAHPKGHPGAWQVASTGLWSTGTYQTTGGIVGHDDRVTLLWQVEHNGPWSYQLAIRPGGVALTLLGPTDLESHWLHSLVPGATFTSVPVALAMGEDFSAAVASLTRYRRAIRGRRARPAPVVFNDFMNTLVGDPTTDKLLPLIEAAAEVGAEYFCVDAGWYDEDSNWWDSVGEWTAAGNRFPGGFPLVMERIRQLGMLPGLWLEPEVVGVRSRIANELPPDAFLTRGGVRIEQFGRYFLDFANPIVRDHLDRIVDRLIAEYGIGLFKFDYNVTPGAGSDRDGLAPGVALLEHSRGLVAWHEQLLVRHPQLIVENCASGGMRSDYAMLRVLDLQSTSDQQDALLYPPIAASAPLSMAPEQAANWAYPQPEMTAEESIFTLATGMLGAYYVSGYLNRMTSAQREVVASAISVNKSLREIVAIASPIWPLGLPEWSAPWVALGLAFDDGALVTAWNREDAAASTVLSFPALRDRELVVSPVFPLDLQGWSFEWDARSGSLTVSTEIAEPTARVFRLARAREGILPSR